MLCWKRVGSILFLGVAIAAGTVFSVAQDQTMEGVVTDAACGLTHKMADAKRCTNGCARTNGFALVVGDKVYKLEGKTDGLADLAAEKVRVIGAVDAAGMKITVASVAKAG